DPTFKDAKIVYSVYPKGFNESLNADFASKAVMKGMQAEDTANYAAATTVALDTAAINYSDGVVFAGEDLSDEVLNYVKTSEKAVLDYNSSLDFENYYNFYQEIASDILTSVA